MRGHIIAAAALAAVSLAMSAAQASAGERFAASFSGFNELGGLGAGETGAILSDGTATLSLDLDEKAGTLAYTLTFTGLSSPVLQAHIHFGKRHVAGNVVVFLCSNVGVPAGTPAAPACPPNGGTVSGTLTAANVIGVPTQNIPANNFDALADAIESNTAYGNIHTNNFKAGEIRGEVRRFADEQVRDRD
jgi:hypothetical protein